MLYVNKDTIKNEILPHLSITKCGFVSKNSSIEIINAILYNLWSVVKCSIITQRID